MWRLFVVELLSPKLLFLVYLSMSLVTTSLLLSATFFTSILDGANSNIHATIITTTDTQMHFIIFNLCSLFCLIRSFSIVFSYTDNKLFMLSNVCIATWLSCCSNPLTPQLRRTSHPLQGRNTHSVL